MVIATLTTLEVADLITFTDTLLYLIMDFFFLNRIKRTKLFCCMYVMYISWTGAPHVLYGWSLRILLD